MMGSQRSSVTETNGLMGSRYADRLTRGSRVGMFHVHVHKHTGTEVDKTMGDKDKVGKRENTEK